ncbi:hypothetical protein LCGC14_1591340, partial [marine sediment metagenome]
EAAHRFAKLLVAAEKREAGLREKYDELIMFVVTKHPKETRHETAMRYIMERENENLGPAQVLKKPVENK